MNIQNINKKMIVVPTKIEDIQKLKELDAEVLVVDFIDENPHVAVVGCLMELQKAGKNIVVMHRGGFIGGVLSYLHTIEVI